MANVVLFHSILGRRTVEASIAADWRARGHTVVVPDLYDGARTDSYDEGFALRKRIGGDTVFARAQAAVADLPADAILAGVSMGAGVAAAIWATRPQTRGVLLIHGLSAIPTAALPGTRVALHLAEPDPYEAEADIAWWRGTAAQAGLAAEIFRYAAPGHYFLDRALPDYDGAAAAMAMTRMQEFLDAG